MNSGNWEQGTGNRNSQAPEFPELIMRGHSDAGDGDQDNYCQGREAGDRGADDGKDPAAVKEDADDAQDERKAQRPKCGQPSKGWKNRASARPNQKHCQDNKPRHQGEDKADRAEDGPFRFRCRNHCARFAAGSDIVLSHGPCLSAARQMHVAAHKSYRPTDAAARSIIIHRHLAT
jgi:hypothetical protein